MLKKPIYENENNVELYALYSSESNNGQKKCPLCGRSGMTVAAAVLQGYEVPGGHHCLRGIVVIAVLSIN